MKRSNAPSRRKLAFKPPRALDSAAPATQVSAGKPAAAAAADAAIAQHSAQAAKASITITTTKPSLPMVASTVRPSVLGRGFKRPLQTSNSALHNRPAKICASSTAQPEAAEAQSSKYFNVMYTKDPYTKKKRRMSDGVLSLNGRQAQLYDDAGTYSPQQASERANKSGHAQEN